MTWLKLAVAVVALTGWWVIATPQARAECIEAPDLAAYQELVPEDFAVGATRLDALGRVVASVNVNGQGPFRFIVDTGANRSVLSQNLAEHLGLVPYGSGEVHSVHGVTIAPLADVQTLQYGRLALGRASMPVLEGPMLAGEQGLLGVDGMRGRRLRIDFEQNCIEILPASRAPRLRGNWLRMRGQLRFGHLLVLEGSVNGVEANMLIDTGSNVSLANVALREALGARFHRQQYEGVSVAHTAGEPVFLEDSVFIPRVSFGAMEVRSVRAYVGDFHIFSLWGLTEEPTLLVGMDVLARSRAMAIDYSDGDVYFRLQTPRTRLQFSR